MTTRQMVKRSIYITIGVFAFINVIVSCSGGSTATEYEEIELPSKGLATILKEVQTEQFKIEDEITLPTVEDSYIVAKYLDSTIDTFTLAEVRLMEKSSSTRHSSLARAASYGFFGYMMGRSMSSPVRSSAYMDQKTHNRVNKTTGNNMRSTAKRTKRAKPGGKKGFGSGKSSRSYGG